MGNFLRGISLKPEIELDGSYISSLPAVQGLLRAGGLRLREPVCFLAGENGSGKSTLLEAIAVSMGFNPEGGSRNHNFHTSDTHSALYRYLVAIKEPRRPSDGFFLRAESMYNLATNTDEMAEESDPSIAYYYYGGKSLHEASHGESFMNLMLNRFSGDGLYLLDEPESALSPTNQFALLALMDKLVQLNSQLIISTHSPILLAYPRAEIYVLQDGGIALTPYKETEHYMLYKQFLDRPEQMLHYILED